MVSKKTMLGVMIGIMVTLLLYFAKNLVCSRLLSSKSCQYTNVKLTEDTDQDDNGASEKQILNNVEDLNIKLEGMGKIIDKLK